MATSKQVVRELNSPLRLEVSERKLILRAGDLLLITAGILGALAFWTPIAMLPLDAMLVRDQLLWIALISIGWIGWLSINDLYDLRRAAQVGLTVRRIALGGLVVGILYLIYFFLSATPLTALGLTDLSAGGTPLRLAPAVAILGSTLLLILWRAGYAMALGGPHARRRVLILGAGNAGSTIAGALRGHAVFDLVGFIDDDTQKVGTKVCDTPVITDHRAMINVVEDRAIDEIVVAISEQVKGSLFQAIMDCHERGVTVTPMPLLYEQLTGKVAVEHIGSQWYVALPLESHPFGALHRLGKRALDFVCGLLLGVVFLVTLPLVALAIKLDSSGPVFYTQERMGLHGKPFRVKKYRSMVQDAERDGQAKWATKNDDRITRVGRFIRKTRIDELPQVWNIIKGEMSMVGPRPERPQFIEKLQRQIPFYRTRLAAKPGLTGWAQVSYGYGATVEDAMIKLQYDLFYIKHQSLWFDLKIMLRTVAVVLKMKGQ
jgi:exopolysaccharide biosynthesis polyprenyl glycosylphosphotransferase